jgi:MYXO-CTERM domain-containing protein
VVVERVCANLLQRFDESQLAVAVNAPAGFTVQAPTEVTLPEALCVQGGGSVEFDIILTAGEGAARGEPLPFALMLSQTSSDPLQPAPSPRTDAFELTVQPDPEPIVEPEPAEKESPAPAAVLLVLGLVALAALRRRF